ncbi:hypothetical protein BDD43_2975 [Mucilaginibacter gracilis]|uniref:Uncharacterized protein n=1 Tax=Mucilaginibacter gracilis TaxID=423350 RepID=A0A495J1J0_9SPHI|nr:hypothetical protein [Mucilaginibacter gracilis]RKR82787.1 hypothetical protein BDD43_2975 [Mucilaginibacter gracilis]
MGRPKRKRITKELIGEIVVDELAFSENIGSKNARKIGEKSEQLHIEIWFDKHYLNRVQFGSDDGEKREGIDEETIKELVKHSISHLINYAFKVKNFAFVNSTNPASHSLRVVLQKDTADGLLNVAVGFYERKIGKYEVTVFTAMVTDTFRISDGQYVILIDGDESSLKKMDNRRLIEITTNP